MQEIIIYRNPAEAAFWNMIMSGDAIVYLIAAAAFIGGVWLTNVAGERTIRGWSFRRYTTAITLVGGALSSVITFLLLVK